MTSFGALALLASVPCYLLLNCRLPAQTASSGQVLTRRYDSHLPANAHSCSECHESPVLGGSSPVTVTRAGNMTGQLYEGAADGGILHRINVVGARRAPAIRGLRVSLPLLGDGYVEAVPEKVFEQIASRQIEESGGKIRGECIVVSPVRGASGTKAVGRFGWKAQNASVLDAAADALRHELGVPNRLFPANSGIQEHPTPSHGVDRSGDELDGMVEFIRGSEPIAPDPEREAAAWSQSGSRLFDKIGCSVCHVRTLKTAPPGTRIKGSKIVVDERLGNKEIHPFSDFLLHDVGTGDGIIQNVRTEDYAPSTADKFRTPPLWGVRFRTWMMHDGKSITYHQAIMRHGGEASDVIDRYRHLSPVEKEQLRLFLDSL